MNRYNVRKEMPILELGCGEGRDAQVLLDQGYDLLAAEESCLKGGAIIELEPMRD